MSRTLPVDIDMEQFAEDLTLILGVAASAMVVYNHEATDAEVKVALDEVGEPAIREAFTRLEDLEWAIEDEEVFGALTA